MSHTPQERLEIWLRRIARLNEHRFRTLQQRNPGLDDAAVMRLYLQRTYPGEFSEARLDAFESRFRERGQPPSFTLC